MGKCRLDGCTTTRIQRFGLCNKHRKWVEKGMMTEDLKMLKDPPPPRKYGCNYQDCKNKHRKWGFCVSHSSLYRDKVINLRGERIKPPKVRWAADFVCIVHACYRTGKITKGFCSKHYNQFSKGQIDYYGRPDKPLKRVYRYSEFATCKIRGCDTKPRERGFCRRHRSQIKKGFLTEEGVRLKQASIPRVGRICLSDGCSKPVICRGLCAVHYYRKKVGPREFVNKGNTCLVDYCSSPAACRGRCTKHYHRWKVRNGLPSVTSQPLA